MQPKHNAVREVTWKYLEVAARRLLGVQWLFCPVYPSARGSYIIHVHTSPQLQDL